MFKFECVDKIFHLGMPNFLQSQCCHCCSLLHKKRLRNFFLYFLDVDHQHPWLLTCLQKVLSPLSSFLSVKGKAQAEGIP